MASSATALTAFPKYSVIIPVYNSSQTIQRALRSVRAQTLAPGEILVIDDCSSDHTLNCIYSFCAEDPELNVRVIELSGNRGPSHARNLGVRSSLYPVVAFLDSDDSWHPKKMELQIKSMLQNRLDLIASSYSVLEGPDDASGGHIYSVSAKICLVGIKSLLFRNPFPTRSVVVLKTAFKPFNEWRRHSEDYDLWIRMLLSGARAGVLLSELAYTYKPDYGVSGLSQNLLKMQLGETLALSNAFKRFPLLVILAIAYSYVKFARRLVLVFLLRQRCAF